MIKTETDIRHEEMIKNSRFKIGDIITNGFITIMVENIKVSITPLFYEGILYEGKVLKENLEEAKCAFRTARFLETDKVEKVY